MSKAIDLRKYTKLVPTPVAEITKEQFRKMSIAEQARFAKDYPEQYKKLTQF